MALNTLSATGSLILDPLYTLWISFISVLPGIVAAILILILGYCVAYLIGHIVKVGLEKIGIGRYLRKAELSRTIGHTDVSGITGEVIKWFVFIIFLQVAVDILNLGGLSNILSTFVLWLPNVLVAVVIFFAGLALAHYIELKMKEHSKMKGVNVFSAIIKIVILFLVIVIGLKQIGIDVGILENSFLLIVAAIALGIALALGIGLGLGMRKQAEGIVQELRRSI